jgi:TonB family protein
VRRAVADPEIGVERVPEPVTYDPPPLPKRLPQGVLDKNGRGEVRIRVVVDTMGVADMKTFAVVKSTHPTLTRSVRAAVAKWKFTPAQVGGCKVPRDYNWAVVLGKPSKAGSGT